MKNGSRIIANVTLRDKKETGLREIKRNMQYSNGSWGDSHRG